MERMNPKLCGKTTRAGTPCERPAGWGTPTGFGPCKNHGGSSPRALAANGAKAAQREALLLGFPVEVHPIDAIMGALRIAWGEVHYYSLRIADLEADEIVGPVTSIRAAPPPIAITLGDEPIELPPDDSLIITEVKQESPQLNVWMRARHLAMDRVTRYAEIALRAGIAERQVRLAEQAGGQLAAVIGAILRELDVFDDARAPAVVRKHLTLIEGTGTTIGQEAA